MNNDSQYHFTCPECGYTWVETWECAADDDCPECGEHHISPDRVKDGGDWGYFPENKYFVVTLWKGCDPQTVGPFWSEKVMNSYAERIRTDQESGEPDFDSDAWGLVIEDGRPNF